MEGDMRSAIEESIRSEEAKWGKKYYMVRTIKMVNYLIRKGYDLVRVEDSEADSNRKVFFFRMCDEIKKDAREYITDYRLKKPNSN